MPATSTLGDVLRALRQRQFLRVGVSSTQRVFEGPLKLHAGELRVRLEIADWNFVDYPHIELLERPAFLPPRISHVDATGGLCYLARGELILDRFNPAGSIELCLRAAEELLNDLIEHPERSATDLQDEFLAYWIGASNQRHWALLGDIPLHAQQAGIYAIRVDASRSPNPLLMISSSVQEVEHVAHAMGGEILGAREHRCWIVTTDTYPVAPAGPLPRNVREMFSYLKLWDPQLSRQVQQVLARQKEYLRYSQVTFAIRSPAGWLGFTFSLDAFKQRGYRSLPKVCLQYLHTHGASINILRLWVSEIGARFIHTRNLTHPTLIDKRITLVGCGAIGGYVAHAIAKLGAGAGRGSLRLIDPGQLEPGNLGRHWLGMESVFLMKATAVAQALRTQFPESTFADVPADVRDVPDLFDADLIIDATGIEAISELINANHLLRPRMHPPVLYAWIVGNGECVQGLWVDSDKYGCYRCLRQPAGTNYREERFPILKQPPTTRDVGCHAFTPYAVSAPMAAAALAADFVAGWLQGSPSPRLRHRIHENAQVRMQKSQDLPKIAQCPACSSRIDAVA